MPKLLPSICMLNNNLWDISFSDDNFSYSLKIKHSLAYDDSFTYEIYDDGDCTIMLDEEDYENYIEYEGEDKRVARATADMLGVINTLPYKDSPWVDIFEELKLKWKCVNHILSFIPSI